MPTMERFWRTLSLFLSLCRAAVLLPFFFLIWAQGYFIGYTTYLCLYLMYLYAGIGWAWTRNSRYGCQLLDFYGYERCLPKVHVSLYYEYILVCIMHARIPTNATTRRLLMQHRPWQAINSYAGVAGNATASPRGLAPAAWMAWPVCLDLLVVCSVSPTDVFHRERSPIHPDAAGRVIFRP